MTRRGIYNTFFFLLMLSVFCGIGKLLSPFGGALLAAVVISVTFYPLYEWLHRRFPQMSPTIRSACSVILVLIFIVTPILLLGWAVLRESNALIPFLKQSNTAITQLRDGEASDVIPWIGKVHHFLGEATGIPQSDVKERVAGALDAMLERFSVAGTYIATHTPTFVLDVFVMLFALFFMFRDGERFLNYIKDPAPMRQENKERITAKVHDTVIGIVRGLLLTSVIQGLAATLGYMIAGAQAAVLLGVLTSFMGLVPLVGTFGVWVPVGVYFMIHGAYAKGIFVLIWGAVVVVGIMDTFVRPYLVGQKAELPMFVLFLALLGGMEVWGSKGILLGPLLVAIAPVLVDIYREQYSRQKPDGELATDHHPRH